MQTDDAADAAPAWRTVAVKRRRPDGAHSDEQATMADEVAIEIHLNQTTVVVTMASPLDLPDLAVGFLVSERFLEPDAAILDVACFRKPLGVVVNVRAEIVQPLTSRSRTVVARASCGLCGVTTLDDAIADLPPVTRRSTPSAQAIHRAVAQLRPQQPLHRQTHAVHAAAWCTPEGNLDLVREDIGRHNALDKLLGARMRRGEPTPGFVLMSSRLSYELVQKAAAHDVATLVAVSAPSTLAVEIGRALGMNLIAIARDDSHTIFVDSSEAGDV
ncbi:MAG: formate dehydrogenase accessory sulfurtransferase FdhD [Pseudomonadota bacterium]